jgi:chloride channel 3/4/5
MLTFVAIIKFILTCFSFGAKIPGGIWMPLISIGACVGRAVGILMSELELYAFL